MWMEPSDRLNLTAGHFHCGFFGRTDISPTKTEIQPPRHPQDLSSDQEYELV